MTTEAYFLSDCHLKRIDEPHAATLVDFLGLLGSRIRATHLFLVGDIFDFWLGRNDIFVRSFSSIVDHLRRIAASGVETHYFEGNHDLYLKDFWQKRLGMRVHLGPCLFHLGGLRVRVEHGDLLDPEDRGYRFLRRLLRSPVVAYTGSRLPGWLLARVGGLASRTSRGYTSRFKTISEEHARATVRKHAHTAACQEPFDLIVTGHVHIRDDYVFEHEGRPVRSVNLGSWAKTPCVFRITGERQEFVDLPLFKT
jgi:UDP-2,3-diacylglucosamine hydrolase